MLAVLATLPWSANAQPAQDARQEEALKEPGKADAPAEQQAISQAKSPGKESRTVGASSPAGTIAGVVVGPDGKPVAGAEVYLAEIQRYPGFMGELLPSAEPVQRYPGTRNRSSRAMRRARTDDAGRFTMLLDPGYSGFSTP